MNVRLGRPLGVISGRPQDVRLGRPQNVRSGRPRDGQIGSLGDVLGTLEGDVLGTSGGPIIAGWVLTKSFNTAKYSILVAGASLLWGGYVKSWISYPGQYSDLSEGVTKTKSLKVGSLIMQLFTY